jgi:hypothetical protein
MQKNKIFYIRAYLAREMPEISMNWLSWGGNKLCEHINIENKPLGREGFFPKYTGYNKFSYFLDKLIMWKWNDPKKKD